MTLPSTNLTQQQSDPNNSVPDGNETLSKNLNFVEDYVPQENETNSQVLGDEATRTFFTTTYNKGK